MSVETRSTKPHLQLQARTESTALANVTGSLKTLGGTTMQWLADLPLPSQLVVVGAGCVSAAILPLGPPYRIVVVMIPLIFIAAVHPTLQQVVVAFRRQLTFQRFRNSSVPEPALSPPAQSSAAAKLYWSDNSPSESVFLRSFDRFEEILQEALELEIGQLAAEFPLRDTIGHLTRIGFLTVENCNEWADCLAVRTSLLLADEDHRQPLAGKVEDALGRMLRLQVELTDRRRLLFAQESQLRQQEEATLREIAGAVD
jgi:hypothetical protein